MEKSNKVQTVQATQPQQVAKRQQTVGDLMRSPGVTSKLKDVLGSDKIAAGFISSVISIANGSELLRKAEPLTVAGAAMVAATLQLPVVPTIGLAYIVPYKGKAQFQIGYKGLIELAERSGQFKNIIDEVVYEGQLVKKNKFTGEYIFDEDAKRSNNVIGYMARFDLTNGFSKTIFWSKAEIEAHALKFSQAYRSGLNSPWKTDFDAMARKTVLKALFSKYAPKSIQMQNAITFDQATIKTSDSISTDSEPIDINSFDIEYIDNPTGDAPGNEPGTVNSSSQEAVNKARKKVEEIKQRTVGATQPKEPQKLSDAPIQAVDTETGEVIEATEETLTK